MIDTLITEYIAVVGYLKKSEEVIIKKGFLIASKTLVTKLLDKNAYETTENKLIAWRGLGWIDADQDRLTKRVSINGQTTTAIKIKISVYDMLIKWTEED